jgi:glutamate/tyrosine decarboxylase-like PLP-dependent enzyme
MANQKLMERIFQVIRNANLEMTESSDLGSFIWRHPAEPLADTENMSIDRKAWALQAKKNDTGCRFGTDSWVLHQLCHDIFRAECMEVVQ